MEIKKPSPAPEIVAALQRRIRSLEGAEPQRDETLVSSGCSALDQLLPAAGFRRGTVVEWLAAGRGSGAGTLSLVVARQACAAGGALVVMDRGRWFYPPAAAALGVDLSKTIVVWAENQEDEIWALDQALRCRAVAAVWGAVQRLDNRAQRRLQLAAEVGGSLGLLLLPASVRGGPTWADAQLLVGPAGPAGPEAEGRRTKGGGQIVASSGFVLRPSSFVLRPSSLRTSVQVLRCRGGTSGGRVELELDETTGSLRKVPIHHETRPLHLAAQLARSTTGRRRSRA